MRHSLRSLKSDRHFPIFKLQDEDQTPNVMEPSRIYTLKDVPIVAVCGGPSAAHCVAITEDGRAFLWGRNEAGQLGTGDRDNRQVPTEVKTQSTPADGVKFVAGACGKSHTVLIADSGDAYAFGSNKHGQLGIGIIAKKNQKTGDEDMRLTPIHCAGIAGATQVSCGAEFSAWVCGDDGSVYTAGLPQYGQLGHGTDHEYNMASSSVKIAYDPQPMPRHVAGLADVKTLKLGTYTLPQNPARLFLRFRHLRFGRFNTSREGFFSIPIRSRVQTRDTSTQYTRPTVCHTKD